MIYYVYRIWGDNDKLLWIGYTNDLERRMREHRSEHSDWIRLARRWTADEELETKEEAINAEARAIDSENPQFNKLHKHRRSDFDVTWPRDRKVRRNRNMRLDWDGADYYSRPAPDSWQR